MSMNWLNGPVYETDEALLDHILAVAFLARSIDDLVKKAIWSDTKKLLLNVKNQILIALEKENLNLIRQSQELQNLVNKVGQLDNNYDNIQVYDSMSEELARFFDEKAN